MGFGWRRRAGRSYVSHTVKAVTVIGGGEPSTARAWKAVAADVAATIVRKKWTMVYCGMGSGVSGLIAHQVLAAGGRVEAIVVKGSLPPDMPPGVSEVRVKDFHERRRQLFDRGDGAIVVPGGAGTIAELTDLVAWRAAGLYPHRVVVYDPDRWFAPIQSFYAAAYKRRMSKIPPKELWATATNPTRITFLLQNE